jgi:parallel beta-helix repeat protein
MRRPTTALLGAAACALLAPAHALADTVVTCGQVVTKSIKLANDLHNCPLVGLEVGKAGITIDLNGHTIDGTLELAGVDNSSFGIDPNAYPDVTIKNGTITQFDDGIRLLDGADRNRIQRIVVTDNDIIGIRAGAVDRLRINDSAATHNPGLFTIGVGIFLNQVSNARVERTAALYNDVGIELSAATTGGSAGNVLRRNSVANNTLDGILIESTVTATRVEDNDANGNGDDGIEVLSTDDGTVISNNRAFNNTDFGIFAAVGVTDGGGNQASGNGTDCSANIFCTP